MALRVRRHARLALFVLGIGAVTAVLIWACSNYRVYVVHTGSMDPTIPSGSVVIVRTHEYHAGQVVSFKTHGVVVTHRLKSIRSDGKIVTKGDANTSNDPWMAQQSDIIGGVAAAPRDLGYCLVYLGQPAGGASALLLLWLLFELEGGLRDVVDRRKPDHPSEPQAL